jgi:hypothetical protein
MDGRSSLRIFATSTGQVAGRAECHQALDAVRVAVMDDAVVPAA